MSEVTNRIISLDHYRANPDNYNEHPDEQIADLRRSVRLFGQVRSVVVLDDGQGGFVGVAGHGFVEAAQAEGKTEVKADVIPPDWTPEKVVAYMAADNETARGSAPDLAKLAALVAKLKETDEELATVAAGGEDRLDELMATVGQFDAKDAVSGWQRSDLGGHKHQVRPVLYVDQVLVFERALRATGNANRGDALTDVCRFYLEAHGADTEAEGQLDAALESSLAALAAGAD